MTEQFTGKARGGRALAEQMTPEERKERAKKGAAARWRKTPDGEIPEASHQGILQIGDVELECYVLKDGRRVFHRRGLAKALGMKSGGGNVFMRTLNRKGLGSTIPEKVREKIENPIVFKALVGDLGHGSEVTTLIDICDAIWEAQKQGRLTPSQYFLAVQAEIILRASAKVGIIALVDEATGYIKDKKKEEYKTLFQEFIRHECREWEREFPEQFIDMIYRLYNLRRNHKYKHPQFFGHFIRKYIYTPLVNSNGAILKILDEKNPVVYKSGGRKYKMFQFLSDEVGLPAFRAHMWQVIGIGSASSTKEGFDRGFKKAFPSPGDQLSLFDDL